MIAWVAAAALAAAGAGAAELDTVAVQSPAVLDNAAAPAVLKGHKEPLIAARFSPDGNVLTAAADQTARVWSPSGQQLRSIALPAAAIDWEYDEEGEDEIDPMGSFSADGSRAVVIGSATAQVFDLADGGKNLFVLNTRPNSAALSADGRRLVVTGWKGTIVWDVDQKTALCTLPFREDVRRSSFSDDGKRFLSVVRGVHVWNLDGCSAGASFQPIDEQVETAAFSHDGARIVTGTHQGNVYLWDANTGALLRTFSGHDGEVNAVAFSADGRLLASGGADKTARVWDANTGERVKMFAHDREVIAVSFSPDGSRLVTASGSEARIWRIGYSKTEIRKIKKQLGRRVTAPAADPGRFQAPFE